MLIFYLFIIAMVSDRIYGKYIIFFVYFIIIYVDIIHSLFIA
jgi:hypothetical protein